MAELQTELLAAAAARDSAERRAELAERQQAESHRLLVSLQVPGSPERRIGSDTQIALQFGQEHLYVLRRPDAFNM